ncbi:MAG: BspA family leucine-rich repeat surface protein [Candidatus Nanosyncoccus sp. P13S_S20_bin.18.1]|nr:BspA family leucine-rich repeat surface protein [Candidatus Nanosyncoccus sp. P13S_S20_bin.18.1]
MEFSKSINITVNTNSPLGYKLLFSSDSEDSSLVSSDPKNDYSIPSVYGSDYVLSRDMHNQYGYNIKDTDDQIYQQIPSLSSPLKIKQVKDPLTTADTVKFNLGFELESSAQPGEYHRNLIFTLLAEDQASIQLVNGIEINKAIKKAVGVTDASYLDNPLTTTPGDLWPNLNITVGRNKCSDNITKEHTSVISVPDSDAEVYLGGYRSSWDELCIWSNATELVFPEDLSYMYAGLGGVSGQASFSFADNRSKSTLNFKKVKNLDHLFQNTVAWNNGSFEASSLFEYLKDSPIESAESIFENSAVYAVEKFANVVNRAKNLAYAFRNTKSLGQVNFSDWIIGEAEDTQSMFESSGIGQAILNNATFAKTKNTANMFKDTQSSSSIQLPKAVFSETTNTNSMFMNSTSTKILLPQATFAKSTDAGSMFEKVPLAEFNLSSATFANATNFSNFFKESGSYYFTLKLPKLSLASAENLSQMFYKSEFSGLTLNEASMGGNHITDMSSMFQDCPYVTEIDLHNISTGPLENIASMFKNLPYIQKITLPNIFNTAAVTDFSSFLSDSTKLTTLENGDKIKLAGATNTSHMFYNLPLLDLKDFIEHIESENITDASHMFYRTKSSQNIVLPTTFKTHNISNMQSMFNGFMAPSLNISNMQFDNVTTMEKMFSGITIENSEMTLDDYNYSAKQIIWPTGTINAPNLTSLRGLYEGHHYLTQAIFPKLNTTVLTDLSFIFSNFTNSLTKLDLTGLDTSHVETVESMFAGTQFTLDVPTKISFDTSNVRNMHNMFYYARSSDGLLDLSDLNVSNVTDMSNLIYYTWLVTVDLTGWDTRNVTDMTEMFYDSNYITTIYASESFVTTNVTKSDRIFYMDYGGAFVGGNGTTFTGSEDITYARIDKPGQPGFFTKK